MKWALVFILQLQAICAFAAEAPPDWNQVQSEKEFPGQALPLRQLGVWNSPNGELVVQILQTNAIKEAQGVWNLVGGSVSGLTKANLAPTSSRIVGDTPHIAFCLSGKGKQEGGATGLLDTYIVFGDSNAYMVKVFSTASTSGFVLADWNLGTPIRENRAALAQALSQIKDRLDRGVSLAKPSAAPSASKEEEFESAKSATDDELRSDVEVWTSVVDHTKAAAINASKREGKPPPNLDEVLEPIYRREANNKFFDIGREERRHPGYQHELAQIAALRGEKYSGGSAAYRLGYFAARYGLLAGILIFLISRWTRRVSRKTDVRAAQSRSGYYGRLLLKMSWRVALLVVLSVALVILLHLRPGLSEKEMQSAFAITFLFLLTVVPSAYLVTSWSHTKLKFAMHAAVTNGAGTKSLDAETPSRSVAVAKALDGVTSVNMTWRRLRGAIVLATAVGTAGLILTYCGYQRYWPFAQGSKDTAFLDSTFGMSPQEVARALRRHGAQLLPYNSYRSVSGEFALIEDPWDLYQFLKSDGRKSFSLFMPSIEMFGAITEAEFNFRDARLDSVAVHFRNDSEPDKVIDGLTAELRRHFTFTGREAFPRVPDGYVLGFKSSSTTADVAVNQTNPKHPTIVLSLRRPADATAREEETRRREEAAFR